MTVKRQMKFGKPFIWGLISGVYEMQTYSRKENWEMFKVCFQSNTSFPQTAQNLRKRKVLPTTQFGHQFVKRVHKTEMLADKPT